MRTERSNLLSVPGLWAQSPTIGIIRDPNMSRRRRLVKFWPLLPSGGRSGIPPSSLREKEPIPVPEGRRLDAVGGQLSPGQRTDLPCVAVAHRDFVPDEPEGPVSHGTDPLFRSGFDFNGFAVHDEQELHGQNVTW